MSKLTDYKNLKGYLSQHEQCRLADEVIKELEQRIEELTGSLEEIKRIASAFPQDKAILKVAGKELGVS